LTGVNTALHRTILACALALCLGGAATAAETLTGDPNHSGAEFVVTHLTISHVHGTIPVTSWSGTNGPGNVPTSLVATLDVKAIDTKTADRDADLRSDNWFDVSKYPTMTFKSTSIVPGSAGTFTMNGDLTMHGVTKPVTLAGKVEGAIVDSHGRRHVGYSATGTLDRRDFGLNWGKTTPGGGLIVSNDVTITLNAEAIVSN
jgi:polyisoprenoid-binding protein YceI